MFSTLSKDDVCSRDSFTSPLAHLPIAQQAEARLRGAIRHDEYSKNRAFGRYSRASQCIREPMFSSREEEY